MKHSPKTFTLLNMAINFIFHFIPLKKNFIFHLRCFCYFNIMVFFGDGNSQVTRVTLAMFKIKTLANVTPYNNFLLNMNSINTTVELKVLIR